jgi:hypothetical protein
MSTNKPKATSSYTLEALTEIAGRVFSQSHTITTDLYQTLANSKIEPELVELSGGVKLRALDFFNKF